MANSNKSPLKMVGRHLVFPAIVGLGLENWAKAGTKNHILNLMYHGVYEHDGDFFRAAHTPVKLFRKQIEYLCKHFDIISTEEAFSHYENNTTPKRQSVTITFDDGFRNNLDTVLPILEQFKVPATFYISGVCVNDMKIRTLWSLLVNALYYFYQNPDISAFKGSELNSKIAIKKYLQGNGQAADEFTDFVLEHFDLAQKLNNTPKEGWLLLDKDGIREMLTSNYVQIGSHGQRHLMLSKLKMDELKYELFQSAENIGTLTGQQVKTIAFPYGDYNEQVKKIALEAGYTKQFAVDYKNELDYRDKQIMNRYGVPTNTSFASTAFFINKAFAQMGLDLL